jgi:hypothetical protein
VTAGQMSGTEGALRGALPRVWGSSMLALDQGTADALTTAATLVAVVAFLLLVLGLLVRFVRHVWGGK